MLVLFLVFVTWPNVAVVFAEKTDVCILPPYPKNGGYTIVNGNSSATPGQIQHSYVLDVTCDPGYQLVGDDNPSCLQGLYSDLPECIPFCQWKDPTILSCGAQESTCYFQKLRGSAGGDLSQRYLDDDHDVCGLVGPLVVKILAGGLPAQKEELPWHAGIYSKRFSPFMQICGGSLVSATVVVSAAHCFWDDVQKQLPPDHYAVAVGKIYRPWNEPHDEKAQKSDVREIHIPPRFLGSASNFQEDLALLVLTSPVTFNNAVRPVCLNFDYEFDTQQLVAGALGKVAFVPYIDIAQCVADSEPAFRAFLSGDKICAGYTNGTAVCKGDSGGGLSFPRESGLGERYYLRGVVSAAPRSDHLCSVYHWATFTHLQRHQHFIQEHVGEKLRAV